MTIDSDEHYREAIEAFRKKVPMRRGEFDALTAREKQRAFTVAQVTRGRVLQQVYDAVDSAVTHGTDFTQFKKDCAAQLIESWGGKKPGQIENVFRTNVLGSYAAGRHAINSSPAVREARPYLRFDDTDDDRECDECEDCKGTILPADDPWWSDHSVPLHFQCRCTTTALSEEEADEEGIDTRGPDVEADEGFGARPDEEGEDWAPDLSNMAPALREALGL
jgi:SPP1 gp7 family putative phage head morphogenesis protein